MGLVSETIIVHINGRNKKHYKDLGYEIPEKINKNGDYSTPKGTQIEVKINDLSSGSNVKIKYLCDNCEKILNLPYYTYLNNLTIDNKCYCCSCAIKLYGAEKTRLTRLQKSKTIPTKIIPIKLQNTKNTFYDWCINNNREDILERWDYKLNSRTPKDISYCSTGINNKGYWFKCLKNILHKSELKDLSHFAYRNTEKDITCNQCESIAQCLLNTYGDDGILKYWSNENVLNPWEVSKCSTKKVKIICQDCGNIITTIPQKIYNKTLCCPKCADGISYPEKFIFNFFQQLKEIKKIKEFDIQKYFKWAKCINNTNCKLNGKKRYDFYLYEFGGIILESQGGQHYNGGFEYLGGKNKNEEAENDSIKENLSKPYVKHYIKIKCDKSTLEQIKENIMLSDLPNIIGFNEYEIDWIKCNKYASMSKVTEVCNLWNKGIKNNKDISDITKVSINTIYRYLKRGAEIGLCDYNAKDVINQRKINCALISKNRIKIIICTTTKTIYPSIKTAEKFLGIYNIHRCCSGKGDYTGKLPDGTPLKWAYLDEYMQQNGYTNPKDIPGVTIYEENIT